VTFLYGLLAAVLAASLALAVWSRLDLHADRRLAALLAATAEPDPPGFDPAMLADLPEPARRFYGAVLDPGAPLQRVARIEMSGTIDLGTAQAPNPHPMTAWQVLAPPAGLVWRVRTTGPLAITGSDALAPETGWSRFRLFGLIPVARVGGGEDLRRSAFGRMVGEGLMWTPAAFLPAAKAGWEAIAWEATGIDSAAVTVAAHGIEQRAEITVDPQGRAIRVTLPRWSDANADRVYRLQPFGGDLAGHARLGGQMLPARVVGGNHYGTELYHPFFRAEVTALAFR
jgi:hypothetical protein